MATQGIRSFLFLAALVGALLASGCGSGSGGGNDTDPSGRLDTLQLEGLVLDPPFEPGVQDYEVRIPICTSTARLRLEAESSDVRIAVNQTSLPPNETELEIPLAPDTTYVVIELFDPAGSMLGSYEIVMERPLDIAQTYLKASYPDERDRFGSSVAVSGSTVVVGAYLEDGDGAPESDDSLQDAGAAYVYVRSGEAWIQQAYLKPNLPELGTQFGDSVAIAGDTIVVGAPERPYIPGPTDPKLEGAGAAFVFVREAGEWTQQALLLPEHSGAEDRFGSSVAISGDTIVVGAPVEDSDGSSPFDDSVISAGAAYIFVRDGTSWSQQAYLKADVPFRPGRLGEDVAIAGDTVVAGGFGNANVFTRSAGTWTSEGSLGPGIPLTFTNYGDAVAIWADTIFVSSPVQEVIAPGGGTITGAGVTYVFERGASGWDQAASLQAWDAEVDGHFGRSLAVWEDVLVVGSPDASGNVGERAGAAYVFFRRGGSWVVGPRLTAANGDDGDALGGNVAIDAGTVVAGAMAEQSDGSGPLDNSLDRPGAAYVLR